MIDVTLPWPPSANRIWRKGRGRVYRSKEYVSWAREAGWCIKAIRPPPPSLKGKFCCTVILTPPRRGIDLDNRIKPCLDILQKMELIENDKFCMELKVSYGDLGTQDVGVRLILTPYI